MDEVIKREEATIIARELKESHIHLKRGNIFSCLVCFQEVLKKMLTTNMLPTDSKQLHMDVNSFQRELASSKIFKDIYGPVTFRDDDIATALSFMEQLIEIKNEETRQLLAEEQTAASAADTAAEKLVQIKRLIERGNYADAQEMIGGDEAIMNILLDEYNTAGIRHRQAGNYDEAMAAFRKALIILPNDEGLYYNIARAYIEKKQWDDAEEAIARAMEINPEFTEGKMLQTFIQQQCHRR